MDLEDAMMSEISQTEKDKYCVISLFMWNKKTPKLIDTETRLKANRRQKVWVGEKGEGDKQVQIAVISKSWGCNVQHGDYS